MKRYAKGLAVLFSVMLAFVLVACGKGSGGSSIPANPGNAYRVIVVDESGAPVKGVNVQFCSSSICYTGETDAQGIASFPDVGEGAYTVHIVKAPEGFAKDSTEYEAPSTYGDITITLKAA